MLRSFPIHLYGWYADWAELPSLRPIEGNRAAWLFDYPYAMVWSMTVGTGVQAVSLSPYMPCADGEGLDSFVLSRLFPTCYAPPSLSRFSSPREQG